MQKRDRKRYSREFKLEAVRRTQITGKSVAEVARELELPVHHLYKWRAELCGRGDVSHYSILQQNAFLLTPRHAAQSKVRCNGCLAQYHRERYRAAEDFPV